MGYPLGPVQTTDHYPGDNAQNAAILAISSTVARVDIIVQVAAVFYSLQQSVGGVTGGTWGADHWLPGVSGAVTFVSLDRMCSGIRFRSAVAGSPATVVAELVPPDELPDPSTWT